MVASTWRGAVPAGGAGWLLTAAALGLAACGGRAPELVAEPVGTSELDGAWRLVTWEDERVPEGEELPDITLEIAGPHWEGSGICNHYQARAEVEGASVDIDEISQTATWCDLYDTWLGAPDESELDELFEQSDPYHEALRTVERYRLDDDRLELRGRRVRLVYEEIPPPPDAELVGTTWLLHSHFLGSGPDSEVTDSSDEGVLVLLDGGRVEAQTGCREVTGTWHRDGDHLRFEDLETGDVDCPDGGRPTEREDDHQLDVYRTRMEVTISGPGLHLETAEHGGLGYVAEYARPEPLLPEDVEEGLREVPPRSTAPERPPSVGGRGGGAPGPPPAPDAEGGTDPGDHPDVDDEPRR